MNYKGYQIEEENLGTFIIYSSYESWLNKWEPEHIAPSETEAKDWVDAKINIPGIPDTDDELRSLVSHISQMRRDGKSLEYISKHTGISRAHAEDLLRKYAPDLVKYHYTLKQDEELINKAGQMSEQRIGIDQIAEELGVSIYKAGSAVKEYKMRLRRQAQHL